MEQNKQKNSKKRLNSLILLVAFLAVMLIVSTYAWFSSQRNVSINSLTGKVNVAEGLQISLDANSWSGSLDLSTLDIHDDAYNDVAVTESSTISHTNLKPSELLPVSTTGIPVASSKDLTMYRGINETQNNLQWLHDIAAVKSAITYDEDGAEIEKPDEADYPGYFAFDVFLQNSGITSSDTQNVTKEVLQLNSDSAVTVVSGGNADVGLQGSVRVGFALFSGYAPVTADQKTILAATNATDSYITDVAIWEPNSTKHVDYIVQNNNQIKWDDAVADQYLGTDRTVDTFADGQAVPTYALTSTAAEGTKDITDIYDWKAAPTVTADAGKLALQNVVSTGETVPVMDLKKTTDGTTNFEILKNTVVKLRIYVWLEGQDVDNVNYASHGGGVDVDIGLVKSINEGVGNRTVVEETP